MDKSKLVEVLFKKEESFVVPVKSEFEAWLESPELYLLFHYSLENLLLNTYEESKDFIAA